MENKDILKLLKSMSDQTRLNTIEVLLDGEKCACEIPSLVKRAQPTVSLQLKYLVKNEILSSRRDGKKILFKIKDIRVKKIIDLIKKGENK